MTLKVTFTPDGVIVRIEFYDLLGKCLTSVGEIPPVVTEKLDVITIEVQDLENLISLLNNL